MKIRNGFVSNSSSSSFCILGIVLSEEDFPGKIFYSEDEDTEEDEEEFYDFLENQISRMESNLAFDFGIAEYSEDMVVVGTHAYNLDSTKTINTLKKEIEMEINRVFADRKKVENLEPDEFEVSFITDGGYQG